MPLTSLRWRRSYRRLSAYVTRLSLSHNHITNIAIQANAARAMVEIPTIKEGQPKKASKITYSTTCMTNFIYVSKGLHSGRRCNGSKIVVDLLTSKLITSSGGRHPIHKGNKEKGKGKRESKGERKGKSFLSTSHNPATAYARTHSGNVRLGARL